MTSLVDAATLGLQDDVSKDGTMVQATGSPPAVQSVRSVERSFDLLAMLESAGHPMGVRELERATGIPRATVQRLLSVMERRDLVQSERGRYRLGPGLVTLAGAYLAGDSLTRVALPVLEQLALVSGETTTLSVRQGFDRVVVQRVESAHALRYTIRIGQRLPLHLGAAGLVLAAAMPEAELLQLLDRLGEMRLATGDLLTRDQLLAKLEEVRRRGFAVSVSERVEGVVSVAAPVARPGGGTIAAIAVSGPPSRMPREKIEHLCIEVRHAAQEIGGGVLLRVR